MNWPVHNPYIHFSWTTDTIIYRKAQNYQVCCKDLWFLEMEKSTQRKAWDNLVWYKDLWFLESENHLQIECRQCGWASTHSLEICWTTAPIGSGTLRGRHQSFFESYQKDPKSSLKFLHFKKSSGVCTLFLLQGRKIKITFANFVGIQKKCKFQPKKNLEIDLFRAKNLENRVLGQNKPGKPWKSMFFKIKSVQFYWNQT